MSDLTDRLNIYSCQECGGWIITRDVNEGVTPFSLICRVVEDCGGFMFSSFYQVPGYIKGNQQTRWEWYSPGREERGSLDSETLDHVERGGLLLRDTGIRKGTYSGRIPKS